MPYHENYVYDNMEIESWDAIRAESNGSSKPRLKGKDLPPR